MSLWDSFTSSVSSVATSAYQGAGNALSDAYNRTEAVTSNLLAGAKQSLSAVGTAIGSAVDSGLNDTVKLLGNSDGRMSFGPVPPQRLPAPAASPDGKSSSGTIVLIAAVAIGGLYLLTRKKG